MSDYIATSADLTSVANAIRAKGGTSAQLAFPADFVQAIEDIETGGGGLYFDKIVVDLAASYNWEIGGLQGNTGKSYDYNKVANPARLRATTVIQTNNWGFTLSANWDEDFEILYARYQSPSNALTVFTTVTQDTVLPKAPYIAVICRHKSDNTIPMNISDINIIKPKLTLDIGVMYAKAEAYDILTGVSE